MKGFRCETLKIENTFRFRFVYIIYILQMFWSLFLLVLPPAQAYSFCPNCIYSSGTADKCNLFKQHPLYKDNPEVNFIGKEICGEKGKYFIREEKDEPNIVRKNHLFREKIIRIERD